MYEDLLALALIQDLNLFLAPAFLLPQNLTVPKEIQSSTEITAIPDDGLIINSPGTYTFKKPKNGKIKWSPTSGACAAIWIMADDVVLEMDGIAIERKGSDEEWNAGILIMPPLGTVSLKNVKVNGGALCNMSGCGLMVLGSQGVSLNHVLVSGMSYKDLKKRGQIATGIGIFGSRNVHLDGCKVQYMNSWTDNMMGIVVGLSSDVHHNKCTVRHATNFDGVNCGFGTAFSFGCSWDQCLAHDLRSEFNGNLLAEGHTVLGYCPFLSASLTFTDCSAKDIYGSVDDCHGMSLFVIAGAQVEGFTADGVFDAPKPYKTGAKATGLEVYGCGVTIKHSYVNNITATVPQDLQAAGFSVWGCDISLLDCHANGVQVLAPDEARSPSTLYGNGLGFGWAPDPRPEFSTVGATNILYENCSASNCQVGFDTFNHIDSKWTNCEANFCEIDILKPTSPPKTRIMTGDPLTECNPPLRTKVTDKASGNDYGSLKKGV